MAHVLRAFGPVAGWAAVLFFLSAQADLSAGGWLGSIPDELVHLGLYAVLGSTLAHVRHHGARGVPHFWLVLAGCLYGVTDEWHQAFVPGRTPSVTDWIADVIGVCVGYGISWRVATALMPPTETEPTEKG